METIASNVFEKWKSIAKSLRNLRHLFYPNLTRQGKFYLFVNRDLATTNEQAGAALKVSQEAEKLLNGYYAFLAAVEIARHHSSKLLASAIKVGQLVAEGIIKGTDA